LPDDREKTAAKPPVTLAMNRREVVAGVGAVAGSAALRPATPRDAGRVCGARWLSVRILHPGANLLGGCVAGGI